MVVKPFNKSWIKVTRKTFNDVLYEDDPNDEGNIEVLVKGFIYYQAYQDDTFIQHQLHDGIHPDKLEPWLSDGRIWLEKIQQIKEKSEFDWI